jgi:hypothetical protein
MVNADGRILRGTENISSWVLNEHRTAQKMGKLMIQKILISIK